MQLDIVDANDNAPEFRLNNYVLRVHENATPGIILADNITAKDYDSGLFARIEYSLHGFGIDRFATNATNGGIILIGSKFYIFPSLKIRRRARVLFYPLFSISRL